MSSDECVLVAFATAMGCRVATVGGGPSPTADDDDGMSFVGSVD